MNTSRNFSTSLLLLLLVSKLSWAGAIASAEVSVDWSSIVFDLPSYTFVEQSTLSEADASFWPTPESSGFHSTPPSDSESSWDATNVAAGSGGGLGTSIADDSVLEAFASASASGDGTGSEGSAHTVRTALFYFSEAGTVEIAFNYLLRVSLSASDKGDYAQAIATFDAAFLQIEGGNGGGVLNRMAMKTVFGPGSYTDTKTGRITFTEQVAAGEQWGFAIDEIAFARATNDIDEPGVLLLFVVGALALVMRGRFHLLKGLN